MVSADPDFERQVEIQNGIKNKFEQIMPARFFTPLNVSTGKKMLRRKFAKMPMVPRAVAEAVFEEVDAFRSANGDYRMPRHRLDIEMSNDEYEEIMGSGDISGFQENAAKALALAQSVTIFQTRSTVGDTGDVPHWGMIDSGTGNGTFSRPLTAGNGTKAGAWGTATYGASDLSSIRGNILKHRGFNDGTGLVLFYPAIAEVPFHLLVPDISGQVVFFHELRDRIYAASEPVGDVPSDETGGTATCALTGAAETATNFEMVAVNPNWFVYAFDKPPIIEFYQGPHKDKWYLRLESHGALIPIPYEDTDGKIYKAMSLIDTCGA